MAIPSDLVYFPSPYLTRHKRVFFRSRIALQAHPSPDRSDHHQPDKPRPNAGQTDPQTHHRPQQGATPPDRQAPPKRRPNQSSPPPPPPARSRTLPWPTPCASPKEDTGASGSRPRTTPPDRRVPFRPRPNEPHRQTDEPHSNVDPARSSPHHRPRQGAGRSRGRRLAPARRRTRERPAPDHEQHHQTDEPPPVTTTAVPATDRQSQTVCHAPPLTPKPAEPHLTTRPHSHPHAATTDSSSPAPTANARQSTPRQPRPQAPAW